MKKVGLLTPIIAVSIGLSACTFTIFSDDVDNLSFDNKNVIAVEGQEGYYTDSLLSMCAEIRGSYKSNRPFTLDPTNESLRVWDNLYLYEYDYFQMIVNESSHIFYEVDDSSKQYVDIDDPEAIIKEGKSGIYKLTFDLVSRKFGLEFKSEIDTPVYEKMDGCDVYTLSHDNFTPMVVNPNNNEELMVSNYQIEMGEIISFHNHGDFHLSNYKVVPDSLLLGKIIDGIESGDAHPFIMVGGNYNLYINPITYAFRAELINPDTANYSLLVLEDDYITIPHNNDDPAYLFYYQCQVSRQFQSMPIFSNSHYQMFDLDAIPNDQVNSYGQFEIPGLYSLEINLKEFTINATYMPQ